MNVDIVMRRHTLSPEDFQALQLSVYPHMVTGVSAGRLPDSLLRFGVRFADGAQGHHCRTAFRQNTAPASNAGPAALLAARRGVDAQR
ncbi:hypothetical protein GCM10010404_63680 [Nonomuraea africana]